MELADWLIVVAILLAPVVAVQVQWWVEQMREKHGNKNSIFETLMATRGARVSLEHVRALNMIDIEFSRKPSKADQPVLKAWKIYRDHLNNRDDLTTWLARSEELFTTLLYEMGKALGHNFDEVQIKRGAYTPQAHDDYLLAQEEMREYLLGLAKGETSVPVSMVLDAEAFARQTQLNQLMVAQLDGTKPLSVKVVEGDGTGRASPGPIAVW